LTNRRIPSFPHFPILNPKRVPHAKRNEFLLQLFGVLANVAISEKLPLLECFLTTTICSNHERMITEKKIFAGEQESEEGLLTLY
jgi:hypothetical protein